MVYFSVPFGFTVSFGRVHPASMSEFLFVRGAARYELVNGRR